jgi:hypothetical protein
MAVSEGVIARPASVIENATRRAKEKRFYMAVGILFPIVMVIGFARSYYLKFFFDAPPPQLSTLAHIHGAIMTAWLVLFTTQIWLVSSKRIKLHMKLGMASIALAAAIVVSGYFTMIAAVHRAGFDTVVNGMPAYAFMIIPMVDLVTFTVFYGAAIILRKRSADHKRLMLVSAINFLPPSLGRMQFAAALGPIWFLGVPTVLGLAMIAYDRYRTGKFNTALVAGVLFMIASYPARIFMSGTDTWRHVAAWLVGQ